jgi:hypothetical protein
LSFADFVNHYAVPARDPGQTRPQPRDVAAWRLLAGRIRRAPRRRLAYLDSMFPWERSGFRYHEAAALRELKPDTMFFSLWELTDPFPAEVHPLSEFPVIAPACGITDVYGVFYLFLAGLCGLRPSGGSPAHPIEGPDLWKVFRRAGIRVHGSIYPGGGFTNDDYGVARARELASRLTTTFSHVPEIIERIPGVVPTLGAFTETRFYLRTDDRWDQPGPLVCLFAADSPPRKGIDVALAAFAGLDPAHFHLHVVGPHTHRRGELPAELATFHGWLSPTQLRDLHRQTQVFISPVQAEPPGPPGSFQGVVDGFPTQAARDAMSSGCLLLSANPHGDYRVLRPGTDYIECEPAAEAVRARLTELRGDRQRAHRVADAGCDQIAAHFDVRRGVRTKLEAMGLLDSVTDLPGSGRVPAGAHATTRS